MVLFNVAGPKLPESHAYNTWILIHNFPMKIPIALPWICEQGSTSN